MLIRGWMMAAGIVHWAPPPAALEAVAVATADPALSQYGPDAGLPQLRQALRDKLAAENGLTEVPIVPCMLTLWLRRWSTMEEIASRPARGIDGRIWFDLGTQICLFAELSGIFRPFVRSTVVELRLFLISTRRWICLMKLLRLQVLPNACT